MLETEQGNKIRVGAKCMSRGLRWLQERVGAGYTEGFGLGLKDYVGAGYKERVGTGYRGRTVSKMPARSEA